MKRANKQDGRHNPTFRPKSCAQCGTTLQPDRPESFDERAARIFDEGITYSTGRKAA